MFDGGYGINKGIDAFVVLIFEFYPSDCFGIEI